VFAAHKNSQGNLENPMLSVTIVVAGLAGRPLTLSKAISAASAADRVTTAADCVAAATELPLRIDGEWYDVSGWADGHPGGRWLLEYARGRDVTALFHAIHMKNSNKVSAALQRLPQLDAGSLRQPSKPVPFPTQQVEEGALQGPYVLAGLDGKPAPETPPLPPIDSPLRRELAAMLRREFPTPASSKASPAHWARTLVALAGTLGCWAGWAHGSGLACLLLPFVHWVLIAHTVHEATHGNLHTDPRVNFWAQFTSHPICFNVFVWIPQHLLSHHQYTNDYEHDVDCHHFAPAMLSDVQPRMASPESSFNQGWTFVWKGCLTTLGTSILQPLRTLREKPTPNYDVNVTPVPAAVSKSTLWLSVLPSLVVLLYPLLVWVPQAPLLGLWLLVWPWVGMSLIFTTMTQVSHVQQACQPSQQLSPCWTSRQIHASLDYSLGVRRDGTQTPKAEQQLVTALAAGLNAQSLHHAMPSLSCAHFPRVYAEYAAICERHGVKIRHSDHVGTAVASMLGYVFENNKPL